MPIHQTARTFGARRVPELTAASGCWQLGEVAQARRANIWPTTGDLLFSDVSLLLPMDGADGSTTFIDESANAATVTANGNAQLSTAQSKFGGSSLYLDGTNATALTTPTSSSFDFGGNSFTVEMWYYPSGAPQTYGRIFATRNGDVLGAVNLFHDLTDPTSLHLQMSANGSSFLVNQVIGSVLSTSTWNHIALTRNGGSVVVFVNGSSVYSVSIGSSVLYYNSADTVIVGGQTSGNSRSTNGYIDDFRITKGVARYTSNFTPPTAAFPTS